MTAEYNLGTESIVINEKTVDCSDGNYHVLR